MKLLIIEDEKDIALPLKKSLEVHNFAVDYAVDGKTGLEEAKLNNYDCILLDLNLPEIDGIKLAKILRKDKNTTPIIMVTARSQMYDKLEGFETGADDYITKPFNLKELIARINALIKRNSVNKIEDLHYKNLQLLPEKNTIILSGKKIELSTKEMGVIEYLLRNQGRIIPAEELLEHVWDSEIDLFTETVKTHIKTLRKKIDPKKEIIKTVRGKGYLID
ncbi:response regulator transcription factor [Candidatus Dojkabacteria bacterium]|nr:response regulator transcription factor [Candidatus Dojkabacteria bacterium]